jgi:hypothetical protein
MIEGTPKRFVVFTPISVLNQPSDRTPEADAGRMLSGMAIPAAEYDEQRADPARQDAGLLAREGSSSEPQSSRARPPITRSPMSTPGPGHGTTRFSCAEGTIRVFLSNGELCDRAY